MDEEEAGEDVAIAAEEESTEETAKSSMPLKGQSESATQHICLEHCFLRGLPSTETDLNVLYTFICMIYFSNGLQLVHSETTAVFLDAYSQQFWVLTFEVSSGFKIGKEHRCFIKSCILTVCILT